MREIEAAAPGHQELAAGARHLFDDDHPVAGCRHGLSRHEPGRAAADNDHPAPGGAGD
jgi:hypothetical protein